PPRMRQIGADLPIRSRSLDHAPVDTGSRKESTATRAQLWIINRRLFLCCHPVLEIIRRMRDHAEQHACMLQPAILGAVADIGARLCWLDPTLIAAVWNEVVFACWLVLPGTVADGCGLA